MNAGLNGSVHGATIAGMTINTSHISANMIDDDLSDPSSPESGFDASDLLQSACNDEVTAQLAASGNVLHIKRYSCLRDSKLNVNLDLCEHAISFLFKDIFVIVQTSFSSSPSLRLLSQSVGDVIL